MNTIDQIVQKFERNRFGFIAPIAVFVVALGSIAASYALFKHQMVLLGMITVSCILCETLIISQCSMKSILYTATAASLICVIVLLLAMF